MDGIHDLGGLEGFGPVDAPPTEPVFGEPWSTITVLTRGRLLAQDSTG